MTMQHEPATRTLGAVALVGSGEYTAAMNSTDEYLMQTLGGPTQTRVALLPTASGLEANGPRYWNDLGVRHFSALGVADIRPTAILNGPDAHDPAQLALLEDANFYYFSGGSPQHIISTLRDSPAWEIITRNAARGAVVAGCSAGAMAMSGYTIAVRLAFGSGPLQFVASLGMVPQVIVFPHFDRMLGSVGRAALRSRLITAPNGTVPVGVDEGTALVRIANGTADFAGAGVASARWRVMGRQTVTIFWHDAEPQTLRSGDEVTL